MESRSLTDLEEKLRVINTKIIDRMRETFKYPGSVQFYHEASVHDYLKADITNPEDINNLLDNDIWPCFVLGSRSQGENEFSTNFYLEGYLKCGIKSPHDMVKLRNVGITPYHLGDILTRTQFQGEINTFVNAVVTVAQEKGYQRIPAQISTDFGHELNYGSAGEQLRAWLDVEKK